VHLHIFYETSRDWANAALVEKWDRIRDLRRVVTGALEIARAAKTIGASLEASPILYVGEQSDADLFRHVDLAEIAITSDATVVVGDPAPESFSLPDVAGAWAKFRHAVGHKCARCWRVLPEVGEHPAHPDLCNRCAEAIEVPGGGAA
ncbi:MAG TPA: zinc finger domain-containing protein, partial [Rhizomicrobium sp.]|nr:zinc finger domain-containing protein [Rhizomicrobium sp.]